MDMITELVSYRSKGPSYVWAPLPPSSSYGHRAELWGVHEDGSWLKEVITSIVERGDGSGALIRLSDVEGNLFADAPLPTSHLVPLMTVVEPVVDSSRYFVLRVEDGEKGVHAFIGLGFRERSDSSDFTAALDDWRKFLMRRKQAEEMRSRGDDGIDRPPSFFQYALNESEQIKLNLKKVQDNQGSSKGLLSSWDQVPLIDLGLKTTNSTHSASQHQTLPAKDEDWGDFVTG